MSSTPVPAPAPGAGIPGAPQARKRRSPFGREGLLAYAYLAPALILLAVFLVYPMLYTIRLSFYAGRNLGFDRWVGWDNFDRLLTRDHSFLDVREWPWSGAVINNVKWMIL